MASLLNETSIFKEKHDLWVESVSKYGIVKPGLSNIVSQEQ